MRRHDPHRRMARLRCSRRAHVARRSAAAPSSIRNSGLRTDTGVPATGAEHVPVRSHGRSVPLCRALGTCSQRFVMNRVVGRQGPALCSRHAADAAVAAEILRPIALILGVLPTLDSAAARSYSSPWRPGISHRYWEFADAAVPARPGDQLLQERRHRRRPAVLFRQRRGQLEHRRTDVSASRAGAGQRCSAAGKAAAQTVDTPGCRPRRRAG